jgi:uncharacterized membrane protein YgdD (TMEM256/DUF423 family)
MPPLTLNTTSPFWALGCASGCTAILCGAFGAHALASRVSDPKRLAVWATASSYHLAHAGALLLSSSARGPLPGILFASGTALFSGSLYLLVLTQAKWLGAVTPLGGLALAGGWLALLAA